MHINDLIGGVQFGWRALLFVAAAAVDSNQVSFIKTSDNSTIFGLSNKYILEFHPPPGKEFGSGTCAGRMLLMSPTIK